MNFEKCLCFDGEIMPNSARYYTAHKSKLLGDVSFIKDRLIENLRGILAQKFKEGG
jgi:hypothetical protein